MCLQPHVSLVRRVVSFLSLAIIAILLTSCTSQSRYDMYAHMINTAQVCAQGMQTVLKVQAKEQPQFADQRDALVYAALQALSRNDIDVADCQQALIAAINADAKLQSAWINGGFSAFKFVGGAWAATEIVGDLSEAFTESGQTSISNSRVVTGTNSDASGDGAIVGNTAATHDSFSEGGFSGDPIIGSPDQSEVFEPEIIEPEPAPEP